MFTLANYIDHTLLSPVASETDIRKLCADAWQNQFSAICIAPGYVPYVVEMLEFCPVKIDITTIAGYPFGFSHTAVKALEIRTALAEHATQIEVVMNLSRFKSMAYLSVREELRQLADIAHEANARFGIIVETALLDTFELHTAFEICSEAQADYVNLSAGYDAPLPAAEKVKLCRSVLPRHIDIKVSGLLESQRSAEDLVEAGAVRIGTFDAVKILADR